MDDAICVRVAQRLEHLDPDSTGHVTEPPPEALWRILLRVCRELRPEIFAAHRCGISAMKRTQQLAESESIDELHGEVGHAALLSECVHLHDRRMRQLPHCRGLTRKTLFGARKVELLWADQLERDLAAERGLLGAIDHAHASTAETLEEAKLPQALGKVPALDREPSLFEPALPDLDLGSELRISRTQCIEGARSLRAFELEKRGELLFHLGVGELLWRFFVRGS
jgi:hypothetical protein